MQDDAARSRLLHPADGDPGKLNWMDEIDVKHLWGATELAVEGFEGGLELLPTGHIHLLEGNR